MSEAGLRLTAQGVVNGWDAGDDMPEYIEELRKELALPPGDGGLREAFVQGAKWWEFESTKATMWQSDQNKAWQEAGRRATNGSLGILDPLAPRKEGDDAR